ncbi:hypothetical protein PHISCL_02748 [Aspergillus sclerotialis]|uniref:Protein kinase domain-containing protein n=1 Tax=Aspergillus sclerotialis TaxID=2070753 RepID=A0A3A2ZPM8_9EURO|nr:hypothetical protein PHISCL_02748 [Aspergillus sclerotialis]
MDLDRFLQGQFSTMCDFSLIDLIREARNVVGALVFLHEMLQIDYPGSACCHNDLKPANILVFRDPDSSPVGTWKIADFGISGIGKPVEQQSGTVGMPQAVTPSINAPPARPASTYQAPEVSHGGEIGRRSDVWSLGCVFVRIWALGIDGLDGLKTLDAARGQPAIGEPDYRHDYFHRGSPPYLNPHIQQWLDALPTRATAGAPTDFWSQSRNLLLSMLSISRQDRPSAKGVFDQLCHIERRAPNYRITSITITEPTSASPGTSKGSHSDSRTPLSPQLSSSSVSSQPLPVKYLVEAIVSGQVHDLKTILHTGVNVEEEYEGERPLLYAIKANSVTAVEALREHAAGLDVETADRASQTPLVLAAAQGNPEMVDILLSMGANINGTSNTGLTPLMLAARWGHLEVVMTLLNQKANCEVYSPNGWNALHYAVHGHGTGKIIKLLIKQMDVDSPTVGGGDTPLIILCKLYRGTAHWPDKFTALLSGGPDANKTDITGQHSPLSIAIEGNYVELAEYLIKERGAILPSIYHRRSSISSLPLDMAKVVRKAKEMEESASPRRNSVFSQSSTRFSGIWHKSRP